MQDMYLLKCSKSQFPSLPSMWPGWVFMTDNLRRCTKFGQILLPALGASTSKKSIAAEHVLKSSLSSNSLPQRRIFKALSTPYTLQAWWNT